MLADPDPPATYPASQPLAGDDAAILPTEAAHDRYLAVNRFGSLDGLRCFCIIAVLWHHGPWWEVMANPPLLLLRGLVGVDFFFVLSGYLITTLLVREWRAAGRLSLSAFYWRRALRILPVYVFVVTLVAVYYIGIKGQTQHLAVLPYYYFFLANFIVNHIPLLPPMWSLAMEEQYYLIWPLVLLLLPQRWLLPALAILIALNVLAAAGALGLSGQPLGPLYIALPPSTYAPILIGSALAIILDRRAAFSWIWPTLGHRLSPPIAFIFVGALLQFLPVDLTGLPYLILHLAMALALATLVMREDHVLAPLLTLRPVTRIGQISYGIYLYHLIALHVCTLILTTSGSLAAPLLFLGYSALSVLMADASDRTLERYFRKFRHRIAKPGAAESP